MSLSGNASPWHNNHFCAQPLPTALLLHFVAASQDNGPADVWKQLRNKMSWQFASDEGDDSSDVSHGDEGGDSDQE
jgi:hypothetical protein